MKPVCDATNCEKQAIGNKIYCGSHYMRWYRYGDANRVKFTMPRVYTGKRNFLTRNDTCTVNKCNTLMLPGGAKGMCKSHYGKFRKYGDPRHTPVLVRVNWESTCVINGCENRVINLINLCQTHTYRLKVHGDVYYTPPEFMSKHPLYKTWKGMRQRCNNPNSTSYPLYGGKGIYVCDRWDNLIDGFKNFISDMGDRSDGLSIDRIDNNGPYSPGNCRWATPVEQNNNKNNNVLIEINGTIKTIADWAKVSKIDQSVIYGRIKLGWSIEDAVWTPVHVKGMVKNHHST